MIDLLAIERKIDVALSKETPKTLRRFLRQHRNNNKSINVISRLYSLT